MNLSTSNQPAHSSDELTVTLQLHRNTVQFFKEVAQNNNRDMHVLMQKLLDTYAQHHRTTELLEQ